MGRGRAGGVIRTVASRIGAEGPRRKEEEEPADSEGPCSNEEEEPSSAEGPRREEKEEEVDAEGPRREEEEGEAAGATIPRGLRT